MMYRGAMLGLTLIACTLMFVGSAMAGGFEEDRPWLAERSAWSETAGAGGGLRGWWAVGNSRVFGIVGTGNPITLEKASAYIDHRFKALPDRFPEVFKHLGNFRSAFF